MAAANLLGLALATHSALADNPAPAAALEIGARSAGISSERYGSAKAPTRKPTRKQPDQSGNFVYGIINQIRAQSEELCARYGSPGDCLEEAEICLTMRDSEDNRVRLCLNTIPGEGGGDGGAVQKSRLRR
ncbi:hypothetical protein [Microvirga vignae]|uniref:hypothetical protein n=1 Tax=Microvirga vignae TaxID=1225564 RepID=UPI0006400213|nr:hypothetical protein [Microvirga vignae]